MKLLKIESEKVLIELNENEVIILNNVLNEICNGLKIESFQTRIGVEREEVESMLNTISKIINTF